DDKVAAPGPATPGAPASSAQAATKPTASAPSATDAATDATITRVPPPPGGGSGPALAIGAGPSVGFGMSSSPILLGRLFAALAWPRVSLELGALVSVPATTRRPDGAG